MQSRIQLCRTTDVANGAALKVETGGLALAVFNVDGEFLGRGTTPPRACAQVNCAQGFYWRWVAVRTGDTGIDLSAACRKSTPPCMVPVKTYAVTVEHGMVIIEVLRSDWGRIASD